MSPRRAVLVALLVLAGTGRTQAECAKEGQAMSPASDDVSPKQLERTTRKILGSTFARVVREAPWRDIWVGDSMGSQPTYFIEAFEDKLVLPRLRFVIAAPKPFSITSELDIATDKLRCLPIDVSTESNANDGALTVRAPITVTVTFAVGGLKERVSLQTNEATLRWQRDGGRLHAALLVAGLELGLVVPGHSATNLTLEEIRNNRALDFADDLLVRSLGRAGSHRVAAVAMLRDLGFEHLAGDSWVRLRQLQAAKKLSDQEVGKLDWLARRPIFISGDDVATFTSPASRAQPRVFVAGQEITGWTRVADHGELRVGMRGLSAVRVEFADGNSQSFITVLDRDVRIRLLNIWGPTLETPAPGAGTRCGVVRDNAVTVCELDAAAASKPFSLQSCGGAAAEGSVIDFGVSLVPSLPGLYIQDRSGLRFDPDAACEVISHR